MPLGDLSTIISAFTAYAEEEKQFQSWYSNWSKLLSLNPNPYDPLHHYDYRKAWKAGASPTWQSEHQQFRWPDEFKEENYPYK
jgi:hypothetical protein